MFLLQQKWVFLQLRRIELKYKFKFLIKSQLEKTGKVTSVDGEFLPNQESSD